MNKRKNNASMVIQIGESLTIENVMKIKNQILDALKSGNDFILRSEHMKKIDFAGVQLLAAITKFIPNEDGKIIWELKIDDKNILLFRKTGFQMLNF
ncbi:MAG: STAS domain-containing protein [Bacteroidales bacterium]